MQCRSEPGGSKGLGLGVDIQGYWFVAGSGSCVFMRYVGRLYRHEGKRGIFSGRFGLCRSKPGF